MIDLGGVVVVRVGSSRRHFFAFSVEFGLLADFDLICDLIRDCEK